MVDQNSNDDGFSLEGRVALVTGGGRGIGEGICMGFAKAGADLVVAARSADEINRVAAAAQALGRRAIAVETDVGDLDSLDRLFEAVRGNTDAWTFWPTAPG